MSGYRTYAPCGVRPGGLVETSPRIKCAVGGSWLGSLRSSPTLPASRRAARPGRARPLPRSADHRRGVDRHHGEEVHPRGPAGGGYRRSPPKPARGPSPVVRRAGLGLRTDELRAMFTAVLRTTSAEFGAPYGFIQKRRGEPSSPSRDASHRVRDRVGRDVGGTRTVTHPRLLHAELTSERVRLVPSPLSTPRPPTRCCTATKTSCVGWFGRGRSAWSTWRTSTAAGFWRRITATTTTSRFSSAETGDFAGCIGPRFAGHPATGGRRVLARARLLGPGPHDRGCRAGELPRLPVPGRPGDVGLRVRGQPRVEAGARAERLLPDPHRQGEGRETWQPIDEWYFTLLRHEYEERGERRPLEERVDLV